MVKVNQKSKTIDEKERTLEWQFTNSKLENTLFFKPFLSISKYPKILLINSFVNSFFKTWIMEILKDHHFDITKSTQAFKNFTSLLGDNLYIYQYSLFAELILIFSMCILFSFTLSFFGQALVFQENKMDLELLEIEKSNGVSLDTYKPHIYPFRVTTLNLVPLIFLKIEYLKNLCLLGCTVLLSHNQISIWIPDSIGEILLKFSNYLLNLEPLFLRIAVPFTTLSLLLGTLRIVGHYFSTKTSNSTPNVNSQPPGLSKVRDLKEDTWKKDSPSKIKSRKGRK
ncbi:hypothetical protein HDV02_004104 [Globomyces sp. JEL0801]|nr:hypothetical protein HDV02_004104 [Globomyces sp. JEL0801]